jgi:hypothetical protein
MPAIVLYKLGLVSRTILAKSTGSLRPIWNSRRGFSPDKTPLFTVESKTLLFTVETRRNRSCRLDAILAYIRPHHQHITLTRHTSNLRLQHSYYAYPVRLTHFSWAFYSHYCENSTGKQNRTEQNKIAKNKSEYLNGDTVGISIIQP